MRVHGRCPDGSGKAPLIPRSVTQGPPAPGTACAPASGTDIRHTPTAPVRGVRTGYL